MIDYESIVFTRVSAAVSKKNKSASVVGDELSQTPTVFPTIVIEQTNNSVTDTDLENTEEAVECIIQASVYTNGSSAKSTSKTYEKVIDDAMNRMGFQRTYGFNKVENLMNDSVLRRIARYRRKIASGDKI